MAVCQLKYIRLYKKSSLDQQDNGVSQFYEACEQSLLIQSEMFSNRSGLWTRPEQQHLKKFLFQAFNYKPMTGGAKASWWAVRVRAIVFTLNSHSASFHPGVQKGAGEFQCWG